MRSSIQSWKADHAVKPDGFTFEGIAVLGFAAGKAVADLAWYGVEAAARRSLARSIAV